MEKNAIQVVSKSDRMFSLISQHENSGVSVKKFCKQKGLSVPTFYYWHKKYHTRYSENTASLNNFHLLHVEGDFMEEVAANSGVFAEYKGIRFYKEPSASLLKSLIS